VEHRADGSVDVGRVHSGERVTQVDGNAVGQARGKPEYPAFAAAGGKAALVESGDRGGPSIAAMRVVPSVMLLPTSTKALRKSSRQSHDAWLMRSPAAASAG
jgi:hypothetical protein